MATFEKIEEDGQESWSVTFDLPGEESGNERLTGFVSRTEAYLAYIVFMLSYKQPDAKVAPSKPFKAAVELYLLQMEHSVKESTFVSIEADFNNHIIPFFREMPISEIKATVISDWILWLNDTVKNERFRKVYTDKRNLPRTLSHGTMKKIKGHLNQFFRYCIDNEIINYNPCARAIKLKRNAEIAEEMLIWDESEFKRFIEAVDDIVCKTFFSFLYLTGCRRGEALALTWKDIKTNSITINKTLGYHTKKGGYSITTPKNRYSKREIIVPDNLIILLGALKKYYKTLGSFSESNFIFGNDSPLPPETIRRRLKEYCEIAKVKLIRIHDFRHSHTSLLISKGHDIVTISRRLGHSDIEMTLNRYAHLMPNKQTELMSSLNIIAI